MPVTELEDAPPEYTELKIRNRTPAKLKATPPAFLRVIGSLRKKKAKIIVKIGPRVPIIVVSMAVDMVMA